MKTISRTIEKYEINAKAVKFINGELTSRQLEKIITGEKVDEVKASKLFESQLELGEQVYIIGTKIEVKKYEVPTDEFIKLAEKLDKQKAEEMKEEVEKIEAL